MDIEGPNNDRDGGGEALSPGAGPGSISLAQLLIPRVGGSGGWSPGRVQAAENLLVALERKLEADLQHPVELGLDVAGEGPRDHPAVLKVRLEGGIRVHLGQNACRGLLDAIAKRAGAFAAVGPPSPVERSLLELLCARTVGGLAEAGRGIPALEGVEPKSAHTEPELGKDSVRVAVKVLGRSGAADVLLPPLSLPREPSLAIPGGSVELRLALPPVALSARDLAALAPGAIVLTDLTAPPHGPISLELVTTTGWRAAGAQLVDWESGAIRFTVGAFGADVPALANAETPALITIGGTPFDVDQWSPWPEGEVRSVPMDGPGFLHVAGSPSRKIELVSHGGRVAARLLEA